MPRLDRRYNGFDVIRIFDKNLDINSKRLVIAYFFSTLPLKEPKVDVLQFILDIAGLIPVAGTAAKVFELSIATAQVIKDIAELFGLEFEDLEVELARVKKELETVEEELRRRLDELNEVKLSLDNSEEQAGALRATIELLEDENRALSLQVSRLPARILAQFRRDILFFREQTTRITREVSRTSPPLSPVSARLVLDRIARAMASRLTEIERRL